MDLGMCSIREQRLVARLQALRVKGEVIEKKTLKAFGDDPEKRVLFVRFKDRTMEKQVDESEFAQTEIGGTTSFTPPIPERDACVCHCFAWLIGGIAAGVLSVWAITCHFQGRTAAILSFAAAGWIGVLAWARISCHAQNRCLRDLERELRFFETNACEKEDGHEPKVIIA
jgi:hypothetical protein